MKLIKQVPSVVARLRVAYLAVIAFAFMALVQAAHATETTLFEDATAAINTMATDYKALLKVILTGLVVLAIVFSLVRRGAKKAVN